MSKLAIDPAIRASIIESEAAALFGDGYYAQLVEPARATPFVGESVAYLIPVASFLARTARAVVNQAGAYDQLDTEVCERSRALQHEVNTINTYCHQRRIYGRYASTHGFNDEWLTPSAQLQGGIYANAIYKDVAWIAGGIVRKLRAERPEVMPAPVISASRKLWAVGHASGSELDTARMRLGSPYLDPQFIEIIGGSEQAALPRVGFTAQALGCLSLNSIGCPALRIPEPQSPRQRIFQDEWEQTVKILVPPNAQADRASIILHPLDA